MKVFVVGFSKSYSRWIESLEIVKSIEDADIVLFTGGEDINPALYGCKVHKTTYFTEARDKYELECYHKMRNDQIGLGICRGAQLACALNGGLLVQDVDNHWIGSTHSIINVSDNEELPLELDIPSLHHQMMYPYDMDPDDYTLLYISEEQRSKGYYAGDKFDGDVEKISKINTFGEPEVILFHKQNNPKFLAIQGHPEMMDLNSQTIKTFNNILKSLI